MAFCSSCGKELSENAKFCINCGKPVDNSSEVKEAQLVSKKMAIYVIAAAAVVGVALAILAYCLIGKTSDESGDEGDIGNRVVQGLIDNVEDSASAETSGNPADDNQTDNDAGAQPEEAVSLSEKNDIIAQKYEDLLSDTHDLGSLSIEYQSVLSYTGYIAVFKRQRMYDSNFIYAFKIEETEPGRKQKLVLEVWDVNDSGELVCTTDPYDSFIEIGEETADEYEISFYMDNSYLVMHKDESYNVNVSGGSESVYITEYSEGEINELMNDTLRYSDSSNEDIISACSEDFQKVGLEWSANETLRNGDLTVKETGIMEPLLTISCKMKGSSGLKSDTYMQEISQLKEPVKVSEYIFPESDVRYLTEEEIEEIEPKINLWYGRNEIYARHFRIFKDELLNQYFMSKPWYYQEYDEVSQDMLNEYEIKNIELIKKYEEIYRDEIDVEKRQLK